MKKLAFLVAFEDFRDEEYFIPKEIFEKSDIKVDTFSDRKGIATGSLGGEVLVESIGNLSPDDYKGIVIAGGGGALKRLNEKEIHEIVCTFNEKKKAVAAICISPIILLEAGILKDKLVTVWSTSMKKDFIKKIEEDGAKFVKEKVVVDGNIITANGPEASKEFALKVVESIS